MRILGELLKEMHPVLGPVTRPLSVNPGAPAGLLWVAEKTFYFFQNYLIESNEMESCYYRDQTLALYKAGPEM